MPTPNQHLVRRITVVRRGESLIFDTRFTDEQALERLALRMHQGRIRSSFGRSLLDQHLGRGAWRNRARHGLSQTQLNWVQRLVFEEELANTTVEAAPEVEDQLLATANRSRPTGVGLVNGMAARMNERAVTVEGGSAIRAAIRRAAGSGLNNPSVTIHIGGSGDTTMRVTLPRECRLALAREMHGSAGRREAVLDQYVFLLRLRTENTESIVGSIDTEGHVYLIPERRTRHVIDWDEAIRLLRVASSSDRAFTEVVISTGHATSTCSFCQRLLSDERSLAMGYGPICAQNFGLPWGDADSGVAPRQTRPRAATPQVDQAEAELRALRESVTPIQRETFGRTARAGNQRGDQQNSACACCGDPVSSDTHIDPFNFRVCADCVDEHSGLPENALQRN
jgi:hypothetical protein